MIEHAPPLTLLALNTAEGYLQMVVGRTAKGEASPSGCELLCAQEWRIVSQGAEMLTPLIISTLERLHLGIRDISRIACVSGPGSFTGIRLAVSTAAGLVRARKGELLQGAVPLMPLLAKSAVARAPWVFSSIGADPVSLWIITHARKNLVHMQGFAVDAPPEGTRLDAQGRGVPPSPVAFTEILVGSLEEAAAGVLARKGKAVLAGSGAHRNRASLGSLLPDALLLPEAYSAVEPGVFLEEAAACDFGDADLVPAYVRPCDAEESLSGIAASLGLDPQKARQALDRLTGVSR